MEINKIHHSFKVEKGHQVEFFFRIPNREDPFGDSDVSIIN